MLHLIVASLLLHAAQAAEPCSWKVVDIPRINPKDVTVQEFYDLYSEVPVIITGVGPTDPVTFQKLAKVCRRAIVQTMYYDSEEDGWGKLAHGGMATIPEQVEYTLNSQDLPEDKLQYGFDMIIKEECPDLFNHFKIPRYFNENLLRNDKILDHFRNERSNSGTFSWPTLMIGPNRTRSALHTDAEGLPFWMLLLQGRKHWRVLPYGANYHLTPDDPDYEFLPPPYGKEFCGRVLNYDGYSSENVMSFAFDAFKPDFERFPVLCAAEMHEGVLEEGEVMYIPNSAPHGVINVDHTVAVTANYFHPSDKAQQEWLVKNCERGDRGFTSEICGWLEGRVAYRRTHPLNGEDMHFDAYTSFANADYEEEKEEEDDEEKEEEEEGPSEDENEALAHDEL